MTDSSESKVKDGGGQQPVLINGPDKLEIDDSMTETAAVTGRPRRRCMSCRCTRSTVAIAALALLSVILAALLIASVVRLSHRPTCAADDDSASKPLADVPGRVLSNLADDGTPLPWTDIRLPRTVSPVSYALRLRADPSREWFYGEVDIDVLVNHETDIIVLHASSIDVGSVDNIRITLQVTSVRVHESK